jgi:hypothetical protein
VKPVGTLRRVVGIAVLGLSVPTSCDTSDLLVPVSDEPFFYLVLNERSLSEYSGEFTQHALLLTTGSPLESPDYRIAERFEMRRLTDGASFDWQPYAEARGQTGTKDAISLQGANYHLPLVSTPRGLGVDSLAPGERYEIEIASRGHLIRGKTTIPAAFVARFVAVGEAMHVIWPQVQGAVGYSLTFSSGTVVLQQDTTFRPESTDRGGTLVIRALDENLYRYMAERDLSRSGITGSYGVIGASSASMITIF